MGGGTIAWGCFREIAGNGTSTFLGLPKRYDTREINVARTLWTAGWNAAVAAFAMRGGAW